MGLQANLSFCVSNTKFYLLIVTDTVGNETCQSQSYVQPLKLETHAQGGGQKAWEAVMVSLTSPAPGAGGMK